MRHLHEHGVIHTLGATAIVVGGLLAGACGGGTTGAGGAGGSTSNSSTATTKVTATVGTSSGMPDCVMEPCASALTDGGPICSGSTSSDLYNSLKICANLKCKTECADFLAMSAPVSAACNTCLDTANTCASQLASCQAL